MTRHYLIINVVVGFIVSFGWNWWRRSRAALVVHDGKTTALNDLGRWRRWRLSCDRVWSSSNSSRRFVIVVVVVVVHHGLFVLLFHGQLLDGQLLQVFTVLRMLVRIRVGIGGDSVRLRHWRLRLIGLVRTWEGRCLVAAGRVVVERFVTWHHRLSRRMSSAARQTQTHNDGNGRVRAKCQAAQYSHSHLQINPIRTCNKLKLMSKIEIKKRVLLN